MNAETRLPIPGFPDYEATDTGRIISHKQRAERVLRTWTHQDGYPMVDLWGTRGRQGFTVHTLVALAFLGPRPTGMEVCHNDGDHNNNTPGNLRYGTRTENEHDKRRHGTHHHARKTHCPAGHPYDATNTYRAPSSPTKRHCRACMSARRGRERLTPARVC